MISTDRELILLEAIRDSSRETTRVTQRILAERVGLSLGMINALLKRFSELGWITLTRYSSQSVRYSLTSRGIKEIIERSAGIFNRIAKDTDHYREMLEEFVLDAKGSGASTIVLSGQSEFDFLLGYLCEKHGLALVKSVDAERARSLSRRPGVILLLAERFETGGQDGISVSEILAGREREGDS
jgi:hypothetical protein